MKPCGRPAIRSGTAIVVAACAILPVSGNLEIAASTPSNGVARIDSRDGPGPVMQMSQQLPPSQMPEFPAATGAWAVEVVTGGGLMGLIKRTAVDSGGALTCPASCVAPVRRQLDAVAAALKSAEGLEWTLSRSSTCRDCLIYRVSVWVRNEDGSVRTRSASWDSVTSGQVPAAVRQLHEQVLALNTR
jgi:hypothetical protein